MWRRGDNFRNKKTTWSQLLRWSLNLEAMDEGSRPHSDEFPPKILTLVHKWNVEPL